jgi:hypothetical protein
MQEIRKKPAIDLQETCKRSARVTQGRRKERARGLQETVKRSESVWPLMLAGEQDGDRVNHYLLP